MGKVTIEVDSKWVRIARSPVYWIVWALQGAAGILAPFFLYYAGKGLIPHGSIWFTGWVCIAIIWLLGSFYMRLAGEVMEELRRMPKAGA